MNDHDYGYMSVEDAQTEIDGIMANPDHVYHSKMNTPGRDKVMAHVEQLFKVRAGELDGPEPRNPDEPIAKFSPELASAMGDALEEKETRAKDAKSQLAVSMRKEIEAVNASMEGTDIDLDEALKEPTQAKLEGYRQMACLGRGDYKTLTPLLLDDCRKLGMPHEKLEQVSAFLLTAQADDPLASDLTNVIIRHIHKAKKGKQNV